MKSPFVETLVPNETVTAQFLVVSKEIRQKKTGEPYLSLHLADRTGEIEAKMWDNVAEIMDTFDRDHFVKVKGLAQLYNNRSQFTIHKLRRLTDNEVELADFFPCSERNPDEMFAELEQIVRGIQHPHLRSLLESIFADSKLRSLYKVAPAAKSIHHACRSGLLEHVLSLCALGRLTAAHYPEVDPDLLTTGIILHDIGKVEELSYERSFSYSAEGQLLGHIVLGLRLVNSKLDALPGFPHKLRVLIEHMIISHHGELEFGSPKVPLFPEAMLLHHLDNLDSKMNAMRSVLRRELQSESEFTGWVSSLERVLLRKDRYLKESAATPLQTQAKPGDEPPPERLAQAPTLPVVDLPKSLDAKPHAPEASPMPAAPLPAAPKPAAPQPPSVQERRPEPHRPQINTLFAEKLQAVLSDRK